MQRAKLLHSGCQSSSYEVLKLIAVHLRLKIGDVRVSDFDEHSRHGKSRE
jgi:hypothetical protein